MTTNPNLSDLIKRNAALEKENAALQAKLDAICDKLLANSHTITDSPKKLGITPNDKIKALSGLLHEIFGLVKHQYGHIQIKPIDAPAAIEAPKPKYAIGDKVRIVGKQETPPPITDYAVGEYDTIQLD